MSNSEMDPAFEAVLRPRLTYLADDAELSPDASLRELGLDSMQAVELVFDLEDALDVQLPDEAMTAETFETAASLWTALTAARDQTGVGAS